MNIEGHFYCLRWLTALFAREFDLPDVVRLWDTLLASRAIVRYVEDWEDGEAGEDGEDGEDGTAEGPKSVLGSKGFMCKHCYFESYSEVEVRGPFSGHKPTCERHGKEAPRGSEVSNGGGGREAGDGAYVAPSTQRPREAPSKDQALWKAARLAADDHAAQVRKASTSSTSSSSSNDGTAGTVGTAGTAGISGPSPNTKKAKQRAEIEKLKLEMAKSQTRLRSMRTKRDREEDIGLNQLNGTMDFSGGVNGPS